MMFNQYRFVREKREMKDGDYKIIKRAFDLADTEKKGYLKKEEFKIAQLVILGCKPSKQEVDELMEKHGKLISELNSDVKEQFVIDFGKFQQIMIERLMYSDYDDDIMETFRILDARCKGFIDFEDFKKLVLKFMPNFDLLKMRRIFNEGDRDNDGKISFRDFQILMNNDLL